MFVQIKIKRGDFQLSKLPFPIRKCPIVVIIRFAFSLILHVFLSKKKFTEGFHKEARRQYVVRQDIEKVKRNTQQMENTENHSTAGYPLRENHTLKPHDSSIITMNLNQMEQVENFVQEFEDKVKSD